MLSLFLYKNKNILVFFLLVVISLFSISTYSLSFEKALNELAYGVLAPVTWFSGKFGAFVDFSAQSVSQLGEQVGEGSRALELAESLEKVLVENAQLKSLVSELAQEKLEEQYLSSIFGKQVLLAQVVMRDLARDRLGLVLNKGTQHGLKENMPVLAFQSLHTHKKLSMKLVVVGKLTHLTYLHAKVIPILDSRCQIHAQVNVEDLSGMLLLEWLGRSRGFLQGRFMHDSTVLLTQLPKSLPVYLGNEVVTSGVQSIFPGGIKIGTIVEDVSDSVGFMKQVLVLPYLDYVSVQRVWVVKRTVHPDIRYLMDVMQ